MFISFGKKKGGEGGLGPPFTKAIDLTYYTGVMTAI